MVGSNLSVFWLRKRVRLGTDRFGGLLRRYVELFGLQGFGSMFLGGLGREGGGA